MNSLQLLIEYSLDGVWSVEIVYKILNVTYADIFKYYRLYLKFDIPVKARVVLL